MRRDTVTPSPSLDDASHIVGPLLIANALMWAFWGVLCFQLYLFVNAAARERSRSKGKFLLEDDRLASSFHRPAKKKEDVNPWTLDVIEHASPPPPPPLSINAQPHRSHIHTTNRQYDLRLSDISYDPYAYHSSAVTSPITTDETHGDRERRHYNASGCRDVSQFPTHSSSALQNGPKKLSTIFSTASPRPQSIANSACAQSSTQPHSTVLTLVMLRSPFVRLAVFALFIIVSAQVLVGTAYIWQVLVHGWGASGVSGRVVGGDQRLLAISSHIFGVLAFLLSMAFFAYRIILLPALVSQKANKVNTGSEIFGMGSRKGGKLLRPLSLVLKRGDSDALRQRHGVGNEGPGLGGLYAGRGHVQPIPSLWQKLWVKVKVGCGRFGSFRAGVFPSMRQDMEIRLNAMGTRDKVYAILGLSFIVVATLLVVLVSVCGFIVGAQAIGDTDALGSPMDFSGESAIWRAGEVVLNACICCLLLGSLFRSRELRLPYPSLAVVIVRVVGESGIALLLVTIVALGFTSTMTDGRNTIPSVPGLILPGLYANTVLLNIIQSSAFFAHRSSLTQAERSPTTDETWRTASNPLGSSKSKDDKEVSHAGDIEMGIRGITNSGASGQQQVVRLSRAENSNSSTDSNGSAQSGNRIGGAVNERGQTPSQAAMHMERDTFGETSTGLKRATSINSLRNDIVPPTITPGAMKPYNPALNSRRLSGVSQDGLSLDLPVFRKGRRQYYNDYYNGAWDGYDDDYDEDEDDESYLSSEEGGTWDYGYALNMANAERDRERDERERATQVAEAPNSSIAAAIAGQTVANETMDIRNSQVDGQWRLQQQQQQHTSLQVPYHTSPLRLHRKSFPSSPLSPHHRHSSLRQSHSRENMLDEMSDTKSMRSIGSRTSRRSRHRPMSNALHLGQTYRHPLHSRHYSHLYDDPIPSSSSNVAANLGSLPIPNPRPPRRLPPTPYDNNVLVISPDRDPSIAELSLFKAASVAATRASTGSQWSSYTYPKPMAFPELDEDLQEGTGSYTYQTADEGGTSTGVDGGMTFSSDMDAEDEQDGEWEGGISFAEYDPDATESMREASLMEQDIGDALYSFAGMGHTRIGDSATPKQRQPSYHPYASAALDADEQNADARARRMRDDDPGRRRWRVHPLMRMVEMGRFKR